MCLVNELQKANRSFRRNILKQNAAGRAGCNEYVTVNAQNVATRALTDVFLDFKLSPCDILVLGFYTVCTLS